MDERLLRRVQHRRRLPGGARRWRTCLHGARGQGAAGLLDAHVHVADLRPVRAGWGPRRALPLTHKFAVAAAPRQPARTRARPHARTHTSTQRDWLRSLCSATPKKMRSGLLHRGAFTMGLHTGARCGGRHLALTKALKRVRPQRAVSLKDAARCRQHALEAAHARSIPTPMWIVERLGACRTVGGNGKPAAGVRSSTTPTQCAPSHTCGDAADARLRQPSIPVDRSPEGEEKDPRRSAQRLSKGRAAMSTLTRAGPSFLLIPWLSWVGLGPVSYTKAARGDQGPHR